MPAAVVWGRRNVGEVLVMAIASGSATFGNTLPASLGNQNACVVQYVLLTDT